MDAAPPGASIGATGLVSWVPGTADVRSHGFVIRAIDRGGLEAVRSYTVVVENVNDAPVFVSTPPTHETVGRLVVWTLASVEPRKARVLQAQLLAEQRELRLGLVERGLEAYAAELGIGSVGACPSEYDRGHRHDGHDRGADLPRPVLWEVPTRSTWLSRSRSGFSGKARADATPDLGRITSDPLGGAIDPVTGLIQWIPSRLQVSKGVK